ncbi:SulP family inorganic anion transporter [Paraburkholderia denitrificans]|uniref:SulP family inorganic anion transporter n=1 Tax=Paraburkholderia denitrificans TaxID=694025 RepID=A0ABW0JD99_9BURK
MQERRYLRRVPGIAVLLGYRPRWLIKDIVAGIVLMAIVVPAGMGYAEAAHLPPISGLYATIAAMIAYALFGPSRLLVLGPDSGLAALIASIVVPLAAAHPERLMALAGMLAILSGAFCVVVGLFHLGFVTDLLSKPIRDGYINGVALTIVIGQTPKLLGFDVGGSSLVEGVAGLVRGVASGAVNGVTCMLGFGCLFIIFACKLWLPRVPGIFIAVVGATAVVEWFDLAWRAHVAVVSSLPQGLPPPALPLVPLDDIIALLPGAAAVALISLTDISVLSRVFATRDSGRNVDRDQELVALGAANIVCGLLQGFPVTSSASRTPVAESSGAKTQLTGVVAALCVCALLLFAPKLVRSLPTAALGAVVVAAGIGLFEVRSVVGLLRLRPSEFVQSAVCFVGVALVGVVHGIFFAVALALLAFVWRAWRPYDAVLGRVDGRKGYHDIVRHPQARCVPGLLLYRWDAPLFFANAEIFRDRVLQAISNASTPTRWLVLAAEPVTDIDVTAASVLTDLHQLLRKRGIDLNFAEMKGPVKDLLSRYQLFDKIGAAHFFPTVGAAVAAYVDEYDVEWRDWED